MTSTLPVGFRIVLGVKEIVKRPVSPMRSELGVTDAAAIEVGCKFDKIAAVDVARVV